MEDEDVILLKEMETKKRKGEKRERRGEVGQTKEQLGMTVRILERTIIVHVTYNKFVATTILLREPGDKSERKEFDDRREESTVRCINDA